MRKDTKKKLFPSFEVCVCVKKKKVKVRSYFVVCKVLSGIYFLITMCDLKRKELKHRVFGKNKSYISLSFMTFIA